jgi:competence protein ComEA
MNKLSRRQVAQGFSLVVILLVASSAVAQDVLPDGAGRDTALRLCSQCHEAQKAASVKLTRPGWTEEIDKMKALGAAGTDQEFREVLEYLAAYFKGDLDRPLDMNSAEAVDLESVLGLLRRESAALIQLRSKRGPFTSLADLKDLDPSIVKKIDARKDRIVFLTAKSRRQTAGK